MINVKEYFELLGIVENSTKEEIKVDFLKKKSALQQQLLSKDLCERKEALIRLQELTKAYKEINSHLKNTQEENFTETNDNKLIKNSQEKVLVDSIKYKDIDENTTHNNEINEGNESEGTISYSNEKIKICGVCGYKNNNEIIFCGKCGNNLNNNSTDETKEEKNILHIIYNYKKCIIATLITLTVLVVSIGALKNVINSPEKTVISYLNAISEGNYDKAYEYIFLEEDNFINRINYKKCNEYLRKNEKNYKEKLSNRLSKGIKSIDVIESSNNNIFIDRLKKYNYICTLKDGSKLEGNVDVVEVNGFWNKVLQPYKILDHEFTRSIDIEVETNANLSVDGVVIQNPIKTNRGTHKYNIPYLFFGEHVIKTEVPLCDPYELKFTLTQDTKIPLLCYWQSHLKREVLRDMDKQTEDIQKKIIEGSIKKLALNDLSLEFNDSRLENMYNQYQHFFNRSDGSGIYSMNITEVEGDEQYNNRPLNPFKDRIHKINFKFTYTRKDRNGIQESRIGSGEGNLSVVYTIKDNKFVPVSIETFRLRTH